VAIFPEGHYLQVEVAGITRATEEPELAGAFLSFMLGEEFQTAIPEGNWMYPARVSEAGLPDSFRALPKPEKSLLIAPEEIAENRRDWIDDWLAALSR
jgi:thiamine transport system substrate-binding protein